MKVIYQIVIGLILLFCSCNEEEAPNVVTPENSEITDTVVMSNKINEFENKIDKRLSDCCDDSSSNYGMKMCTFRAIDEWELEMNKYYILLLDTLSEKSKEALIESQNIWIQYSEKELKLNHSIYNQLEGTIWGLISLSQTLDKIKERAVHLKTYYNMLIGEGLKE